MFVDCKNCCCKTKILVCASSVLSTKHIFETVVRNVLSFIEKCEINFRQVIV